MDDVARFNYDRWEKMVQHGAVFTRPYLDLTPEEARGRIDPLGQVGDVAGKDVLCLAGGGGQQSAAFALLGARVTVLDLSDGQLARDREAAAHYGHTLVTEQGDMRDLSRFADNTFDIVCNPYSLNFVPEAQVVFRGVARVLRPGGLYFFNCANPFTQGLTGEDWDGRGYPLSRHYRDGETVSYVNEAWVFRGDVPAEPIAGPREYKHTLSTLLNGLLAAGFALQHLAEEPLGVQDIKAAPGTFEHLIAVAPPWLDFWARKRR
jgi:ubiquinone/menaquinone biosynthesis C-methylase UbiE